MSKQAVYIFQDFLNSIVLEEDVMFFSVVDGNTRITVNDIYHLRKQMVVKIDEDDYTVLSIEASNTFVVSGIIVDPETVVIPNPFYFHGTPYATNNLISGANSEQKFPMLYLYELLKDTKITDPLSIIDRKISIRFFLLDNALGEFSADEHYEIVINGLSSFLDRLEMELDNYNSFVFETVSKIERFPHANFGKFIELQGYTGHIFNEITSGIEVRFELPFKKALGCD